MSAELIDLESARRERWFRHIEAMRELGEVAIFGAVGEQDATILPFPDIMQQESIQ